MTSLLELKKALADYRLDENLPDEPFGYRCCELALEALAADCYGVGAVLSDQGGQVYIDARNEVFQNGFHSERHAEMVALNNFEKSFPSSPDRGQLTMVVSLEPCPMCFSRLLLAGIGRLVYLAADRHGGMVHRLAKMPPVWRNLALLQNRRPAEVTPTLARLASRLARFELEEKRRKLLKAIRS